MDTEEEILPDREYALNLLRKLKVPYSVRRHSIKVAILAKRISNKITKTKINKNLIEVGALLHDIGRAQSHGFNHGFVGGKIIRNRGLPSSIAKICETHILGGLDKDDAKEMGLPEKDFLPMTLEEKIVCLADKMIAGTKEVSIEKRFEKWTTKFGDSKLLEKSKKRVEDIWKEIETLI